MDIKFDIKTFGSISMLDLVSKWNPIGLTDLNPNEQRLLSNFLAALPKTQADGKPVDTTELLIAKLSDEGILDALYGPGLFEQDGKYILKMGGNAWEIVQKKTEFFCGDCLAELQFSESLKLKRKDDVGREIEIDYAPANLIFYVGDDSYWVRANFVIDVKKPLPTPSQCKKLLRDGESIASYLLPVPVKGEGASVLKMRDMELGEYPVTGIKVLDTQYGKAHILTLADGRQVWSQGMVKIAIDSGFVMGDDPVTLKIAKITPKAGKVFVDCALRVGNGGIKQSQSIPVVLPENSEPNPALSQRLANWLAWTELTQGDAKQIVADLFPGKDTKSLDESELCQVRNQMFAKYAVKHGFYNSVKYALTKLENLPNDQQCWDVFYAKFPPLETAGKTVSPDEVELPWE